MSKESIIQELKRSDNWIILNSSVTPFVLGIGIRQWTAGTVERYPKYPIMRICPTRYLEEGSRGQVAIDGHLYRDTAMKLLDNRDDLQSIHEDFLVDEKDFKDFVKRVQQQDNQDQYLYDNYDEFLGVYDAEYISAAPIDGMLVYSEELVSGMKEKYPDALKEIETLILPYGETFFSRQQTDLYRIAKEVKSSQPDGYVFTQQELLENFRDDLTEHQQAFHWMQNTYKYIDALPVEVFADQLLEVLKQSLEEIDKEYEKLFSNASIHQRSCEEIRAKGVFSKDDYEKLLWTGKIGQWVDRRKEYNLIANYYLGRYLKFVCNKHSLEYEDALFLMPWELDEVTAGDKTMSDFNIAERKVKGFCAYTLDHSHIHVSGDDVEEFWHMIKSESDIDEVDIVYGTIASKGKAQGVVRVVFDPNKVTEFNEGDILVTGMTRPEFVPLMKKAGAIVTDEGGVTCHAAIVSREIGKPCIIGTKIATEALHEGDIVEVNADHGNVRVIKRVDNS